MPQRTLRFRIRQDGLVEETVEGAQGQLCNELTQSLEEALGVLESRKPTAEAYLPPQDQSQTISAETI